MCHPQVGDLELHYEKFTVPGGTEQVLVTYHAEPVSRTAEALSLLAAACAPVTRATGGQR